MHIALKELWQNFRSLYQTFQLFMSVISMFSNESYVENGWCGCLGSDSKTVVLSTESTNILEEHAASIFRIDDIRYCYLLLTMWHTS